MIVIDPTGPACEGAFMTCMTCNDKGHIVEKSLGFTGPCPKCPPPQTKTKRYEVANAILRSELEELRAGLTELAGMHHCSGRHCVVCWTLRRLGVMRKG